MKINTQKSAATLLMGLLLTALPLAASAQFAPRPGQFSPRPGGSVTWSGTVDDTTIVTVHQDLVRTRVVSGKSSSDVSAQVLGRLPDRPVRLFLRQRQGRGEIRIVQQPNPSNNFTGRVRIHDPQPGSSFYSFVLAWRRPARVGPGPGAF